jgi:hypothetical protein
MLVVLGSVLSVLCVPSILVLHKDPLFRPSRVPLRRSRLYDPCNTLLLLAVSRQFDAPSSNNNIYNTVPRLLQGGDAMLKTARWDDLAPLPLS